MRRTTLLGGAPLGVRRQLRPNCPIWGLLLNCRSVWRGCFRGPGLEPPGSRPPVMSVALRPQRSTKSDGMYLDVALLAKMIVEHDARFAVRGVDPVARRLGRGHERHRLAVDHAHPFHVAGFRAN